MIDKKAGGKYKVVIGLEVHAQLLTRSKIFNSDSTASGPPNTHVSVVTLAHPGTLPRLNKEAVACAIKIGLVCHSEISRTQIFDRKNYFYPDLPKGYQITQDRTPICVGGFVTIGNPGMGEKKIRLHRIHIEEDAGKSIHLDSESDTLLDFNRAGVALIEIVTLPEIESAEDAGMVLSEIRKLVRYLDICDGNMEEGSLRCDANISVMPEGSAVLGKKVEVKNMNSIRNVQRAIEHEAARQIKLLENGLPVVSETRTFDANTGVTHAMRTKEELNDYRYFPDPDLSPLEVSESWLMEIKSTLPALPRERRMRYAVEFGLSDYDARVLTESKDVAEYFEALCRNTGNFKAAANWIMGPVKSKLNEEGITADRFAIDPETLAGVIRMIDEGKLNFSIASQQLFPELLRNSGQSAYDIAENLGLLQNSDEQAVRLIVEGVVREFPLKVEEYKNGKKGIIAMFMGEVMKRTKGKADPKVASDLLKKSMDA